MIRLQDIAPFLNEMKGARLSILIACWCSPDPLTNAELQLWTGYSQDTVRGVLHELEDSGWLENPPRTAAYRLRAGAKLPFPGFLPDPQSPPSTPPAVSKAGPNPFGGTSRAQQKLEQARRKWEAWLLEQAPEERERASASLQCLVRNGIMPPKAYELAAMEHINPVFIQQHVDAALNAGYPLSTAIDRMYKGWPPPRLVDFKALNASKDPLSED